jgi:hypothetical protein
MALVAGLLGSGHCLGMCGSLVAALALCGEGRRGGLAFQALYHAGRLATYTLIGLLAGWLGAAAAGGGAFAGAGRILLLFSDLFVILLGLGSAGLFRACNVAGLEGGVPVGAFAGALRALRRLPAGLVALPLGLLFGLLPCGLLYAMALTAGQSAAPMAGGATMLAFGLGTTPALFLFGGAAQWLGSRARLWLLRGAGLMVAVMGAYSLLRHLRMLGLW